MSFLRQVILFGCLSLTISIIQAFSLEYNRPAGDAVGYIIVAHNLLETDVHMDGYWGERDVAGLFYPPLYPRILTWLGAIDTDFASFMSCIANKNEICEPRGMRLLLISNAVFGGAACLFVFLSAYILSDDRRIAWVSAALIIASFELAEYFDVFLVESLAFFLFSFLSYLTVMLVLGRTHSVLIMIPIGIIAGLMVLGRPAYSYLSYTLPFLSLIGVRTYAQIGFKTALLCLIVYFGIYGITISPWLVRNFLEFDKLVLVEGYGGLILSQRIAYNMMTWNEWYSSFIFHLPDFGDDLSRFLQLQRATDRWGWGDSGTFYGIGNNQIYDATLLLAGSDKDHVNYLISNHIIPELSKHVAVTFALAWRGMWPGAYLALVGFLCLFPAAYIMKKKNRLIAFVLFCYPSIFMLGFHSFVSVNVTRYNVPLIFIYAFCLSCCLFGILDHLLNKNRGVRI